MNAAHTLSRSIKPGRKAPTGPHILIVDDDPDMRTYMRGCLRLLSPRLVVESSSVSGALEAARSAHPDVIISDIIMPVSDGHTLMRELRLDNQLSDIPVLLVSGQREHGPTAGDAFLAKPFNATTLCAAVERLLDGNR